MTLTPDQARVRLAVAREHMKLARLMARNDKMSPNAGVVHAVDALIDFLEEALA